MILPTATLLTIDMTHTSGQQHDRTALVLYGTETGNSEEVAEELEAMLEKLHFVTRISSMHLVELVCLLLISSTTWTHTD